MNGTLKRLAFDLYLWQHRRANNFNAHLFELIGKADAHNRARLRNGFPEEVFIWEEWQNSTTPEAFFRKYRIIENQGDAR